MKRQNSNLFLLLLVSVLVIMLALSCEAATNQNNSSEYVWGNCPGWALAEDIAVRLEDLPPGWHLLSAQGGPSCQDLRRAQEEAWVTLYFADEKPWNGYRRSVDSRVTLHWEEQAVQYYFWVPEDSVAMNLTGADEAYIRLISQEIQQPEGSSLNCTSGAAIYFRKGLYDARVSSHNQDLRDLCIEEGEEVDAELAFVTDLATEVASRIP